MEYADNILNGIVIFFYMMIGVCLGSFASAISHRISKSESWIIDRANHSKGGEGARAARSSCPQCHHQLSALDLIPLLSWLFLKGNCRYCGVSIPARYPIIELCGAVMMMIAYAIGLNGILLFTFIVTLPFLLASGVLIFLKARVPPYLYLLSFSNIFVLIYIVLWLEP